MTVRYVVQELVAGRWFVVRAYDDRAEAEVHARHIGRSARVKTVKG